MENIMTIFTTKDKQEMRDAMKEILIESFERDVEFWQRDNYIFNSDLIDEMVEEIREELMAEIKEKLKKDIYAKLEKDLNKLI